MSEAQGLRGISAEDLLRHHRMMVRIRRAEEKIADLGLNWPGEERYTTSMERSPGGRYVYYAPGAHGHGNRDGSPIADSRATVEDFEELVGPVLSDEERENDIDTLGGRLSRARDASGMSTAQFARRLGVKTATVQAWESDRSEPRSSRLSMIAGILNVSTPWLLHGVGEAPPDDPRNDAIAVLQGQVLKLRTAHEDAGAILERIEDELRRLLRHDG